MTQRTPESKRTYTLYPYTTLYRSRLDPTYPGYDPNLNHDHVPFSPKVTARVALQQGFSLGDAGSLAIGADVSYRDKTWLSVDNRDVLSQGARSEEHTSELQSLMRSSYAVFCLKNKTYIITNC